MCFTSTYSIITVKTSAENVETFLICSYFNSKEWISDEVICKASNNLFYFD